MDSNTIIRGNCIFLYSLLENGSIAVAVNSPPYHGCRDYKSEEIIFDEDKNCSHEWFKDLPTIKKNIFKSALEDDENDDKYSIYNFCGKCGAWLGKLGHEPDWKDRIIHSPFDEKKQLKIRGFISHLADCYDGLKDKLKRDVKGHPIGSLFVVIGDVQASRIKGSGGKNSEKRKVKGEENFQAFKPIKMQYDEEDGEQIDIPSRFCEEMRKRGWKLKRVIHWYKPNAMPLSVKSNMTLDYEYVYWFCLDIEHVKYNTQYEQCKCIDAKSKNATNKHEGYGNATYSGFEYDASKQDNKRIMRATHFVDNEEECNEEPIPQLQSICTERNNEQFFAGFPKELIRPYILGCSDENDIVLDMFMGSGTTAIVAQEENRNYIGFEVSPEYKSIADNRIKKEEEYRKTEEYKKKRAKIIEERQKGTNIEDVKPTGEIKQKKTRKKTTKPTEEVFNLD